MHIKFCKRLGTLVQGRIQPLLVGLQSIDEVNDLMKLAKLLRNSSSDSVRTGVYINRNLTKLEAQVAYENRCRRREKLRQHPANPYRSYHPAQRTIQHQAGNPVQHSSRVFTSSHRHRDSERSGQQSVSVVNTTQLSVNRHEQSMDGIPSSITSSVISADVIPASSSLRPETATFVASNVSGTGSGSGSLMDPMTSA